MISFLEMAKSRICNNLIICLTNCKLSDISHSVRAPTLTFKFARCYQSNFKARSVHRSSIRVNRFTYHNHYHWKTNIFIAFFQIISFFKLATARSLGQAPKKAWIVLHKLDLRRMRQVISNMFYVTAIPTKQCYNIHKKNTFTIYTPTQSLHRITSSIKKKHPSQNS